MTTTTQKLDLDALRSLHAGEDWVLSLDALPALLDELEAARKVVDSARHASRAIPALLKSRSQSAQTDAAMCEAGIRSKIAAYDKATS